MEAVAEVPTEPVSGSTVRLRQLEGGEIEPLAIGTIYKVSIGVHDDTSLARDMMYVTPHFTDKTGASTPATIATQIANNMVSYLGAPNQGQVKIYHQDFNPGAPHNPLAVADFGTAGNYPGSSGPREVCLCLSYYSGQNTKRYRGRLYIPHAWLKVAGGGAPAAPGPRPTAQMMTTAMAFAVTVLIPSNANGWKWCVASTVDKVQRDVTNYWVDDEWDIQRRRGFRGTTRNNATVP